LSPRLRSYPWPPPAGSSLPRSTPGPSASPSAAGGDRLKRPISVIRVLGFERIAELAAQPRAPLTLRFGPLIGRRLDQAMGRLAEPIDPIRLPDLIEVRRVFAEPIGAPETIARHTGKLVVALCEALAAK
jgi:protein ImuB